MSRRLLLSTAGAGGLLLATTRPGVSADTSSVRTFRLRAEPRRIALLGSGAPKTAVWSYSGSVPGPTIRARQGERIRVVVENRLSESTTVHWHGIRLSNPMDGVPHVTQKPIEPGQDFTYEFDLRDAGTYMYHSHQRSNVQVPMGLFGPLIVEEREPVPVDRDMTWMLSDWRLGNDGELTPDFGSMMDVAMAGRIGNVVTINGSLPRSWRVSAGERVRLRIINVASARFFALDFEGHKPLIVAWDGQPVQPHEPDGPLVLGPGMRADLSLEMIGEPGSTYAVSDSFYGAPYRLASFAYATGERLARPRMGAALQLAANTMPQPDVGKALRHVIAFGGGMMGPAGMMGPGGMMGGSGRMMMRGPMWTMNGVAATGGAMAPLLTLALGGSYILSLRNDTAWPHTIHLHGHSFRVIARNDKPTPYREWRDTVLVEPRETAEIAFVADNPGNWMIHCHILDHQEAGMMCVIRVA